jgi:hypothetical protein
MQQVYLFVGYRFGFRKILKYDINYIISYLPVTTHFHTYPPAVFKIYVAI